MRTVDYAFYPKEQLEKELSTSLAHGLSFEEVETRQKSYGLNTIEEKGTSWWSIFIRQFRTPFVYLLGLSA
nr:hypothetical protein [Candidatus Dependentiae bacterium]